VLHSRLLLPALVMILAALLSACSSTPLSPSEALADAGKAPSGQPIQSVKSKDGNVTGEVSGTPAAGSKFSQIQIGMRADEVQKLIGPPDELYSYHTDKRWIPFYLGDDARRIVLHHKGEGCLTFTGGKVWGGGEHVLIRMDVDPAGICFQP
jgi:outer membrane protein assembly factor BamE (lipoprotein component of BamABCDE complex)